HEENRRICKHPAPRCGRPGADAPCCNGCKAAPTRPPSTPPDSTPPAASAGARSLAECSLARSFADHRDHGFGEAFQIELPTRFFDVFKVVANPFLEIIPLAASPANLPQAGDARTNAQSRLAPRRAILVLLERAGPRADDRHVADEHIPELRQFIDVVFA